MPPTTEYPMLDVKIDKSGKIRSAIYKDVDLVGLFHLLEVRTTYNNDDAITELKILAATVVEVI